MEGLELGPGVSLMGAAAVSEPRDADGLLSLKRLEQCGQFALLLQRHEAGVLSHAHRGTGAERTLEDRASGQVAVASRQGENALARRLAGRAGGPPRGTESRMQEAGSSGLAKPRIMLWSQLQHAWPTGTGALGLLLPDSHIQQRFPAAARSEEDSDVEPQGIRQ